MRWFTREWVNFELTEDADAGVLRDEKACRNALIRHAPPHLRALFSQRDPRVRLTDARPEAVAFSDTDTITISLVQGEESMGYGLLEIAFLGAALAGVTPAGLASLVAHDTEIWYFEFDESSTPPARFEVRFLLLGGDEFAIRFRDASWAWRARQGRRRYRRFVARKDGPARGAERQDDRESWRPLS